MGLVAGNGDFPGLVADALRAAGRSVVAVAFPEETDPGLAQHVDAIQWLSLGQLGRIIRTFRAAGVSQAIMAGQIRHQRLFSHLKLDLPALALLARLRDKRADTILKAVAGALEKAGVRFVSPLPYLKAHLPGQGVLTRRRPTPAQQRDIAFGYRIAKTLAGADIGQTVVVKNQAVVAVEAMEGTDECIRRGGALAKAGAVVVKVTKPKQDWRFDTPILGPRTVESMRAARAEVLAFEGGRTVFLNKEITLEQANRARLILVGL